MQVIWTHGWEHAVGYFEKRRGRQGCSTDSIFLWVFIFVFTMFTFFVLVDKLQKVKHAWPHTQYCYNRESKSFELNIQNSWLLLKLSGLFNSDELSTMPETKTGEIQGPLKPEEFSQAFAKGLLHLQVVHLTWFVVLRLCCWFVLGSEGSAHQGKKIVSWQRSKVYFSTRREHDWEQFFRCGRKWRTICIAAFWREMHVEMLQVTPSITWKTELQKNLIFCSLGIQYWKLSWQQMYFPNDFYFF